MSTVTLLPLSGTLGAEVVGVDVRGVDDTAVGQLRAMLAEHHLLLFRHQELTPQEHSAFAGRFGPLSVHPRLRAIDEAPELHATAMAAYSNMTRRPIRSRRGTPSAVAARCSSIVTTPPPSKGSRRPRARRC